MKNVFRKFIGIPLLIMALIVPFASVGAERSLEYAFTTIDPPGAINGYAFDISPGGEVVGNYQSADNKWHGFVLRWAASSPQ